MELINDKYKLPDIPVGGFLSVVYGLYYAEPTWMGFGETVLCFLVGELIWTLFKSILYKYFSRKKMVQIISIFKDLPNPNSKREDNDILEFTASFEAIKISCTLLKNSRLQKRIMLMISKYEHAFFGSDLEMTWKLKKEIDEIIIGIQSGYFDE